MIAEYQRRDPFSSPAFEKLRDFVFENERREPGSIRLEQFEPELHQLVMAFEADLLRRQVERYDLDTEEVRFEGQPYRRKMKCSQQYTGLAGTFEIERTLYVPRSETGKAICPLELRAGMVEEVWTPLAARLMTLAVASTTPKEAALLFGEWGGMKPSTSSLDRLPKRISERWEEQREAFEEELRTLDVVPGAAVSVVVSIDGVQVPMKDGERAEKRSQEDKRPRGPAGFREVGCGTISFHDCRGKRLKTARFARMPEGKKVTLKRQLEAELESIYASRPDLTLVCLADAFDDNWDFLSKLSSRFVQPGKKKNEAIDLFHVLERVKMALNAYHGDCTPESKAAFEQCRIWLRRKSNGAERVIRALRHRRRKVRGAKRKAIDREINYLCKRKNRLRYKRLLRQRLPIGSGVVEAACKTLAAQRMKRSGMSWREEGGQAILTFRSLIQSNRWEAGWEIVLRQYRHKVYPFQKAG
jgi:hypothetical protein